LNAKRKKRKKAKKKKKNTSQFIKIAKSFMLFKNLLLTTITTATIEQKENTRGLFFNTTPAVTGMQKGAMESYFFLYRIKCQQIVVI
jgi:hypothetical protein